MDEELFNEIGPTSPVRSKPGTTPEIERLKARRARQGVRVASASRGHRERELRLYELLDAAVDEAVWAERMREPGFPA